MRMIKGAFSSPSLSGRAAQRLARSLNSFHPTTDPALACALAATLEVLPDGPSWGVLLLFMPGEARRDGMPQVGLL